ncbi:hypothetical protein BX257_7136 [Streptomyces sp. 3212.3]|nr:hypothetical protein BX257_7136 [Streptomyces sp. 3212.3]
MIGQLHRRVSAGLRTALMGTLAACLAFTVANTSGGTAQAATTGTETLPLSGATTSGLHNTYDPAGFTYLAQALVVLGQVRIGVDMSRWQVGQAPVQRARSVCSSRTTW